ncbi:glucan biosynthesis protein [Methylocystis bryophila]|uniref:Glucan biosynthesis protein G n=1 Tax=Methylocystis bryophila TaxID=655015 RepID=A0A1W6MUA5_9HYPH|nr:glucan biosynthesis protein [Methylocystis bryophila]ARN81142.1 glucan biosynthesis protein G [Methylocystis bryophila]BDV37073.1 putative glucans biosynthesis protein D [Methylocystis bryophila]
MRALLLGGLCPSITARALTSSSVADNVHRFNFAEVVRRARELALTPFDGALRRLPPGIDSLDFDSWRDIRFRPDRAIPLDAAKSYRLETFHLGFLYKRAVAINLVEKGIVTPLLYSPGCFDYGRVKLNKPLPSDTGFAGLRLHYPLNDPRVSDELISFLGASYFRFLGREQQYGLSARALCVEAGTSEESFPYFREFWLEVSEEGEGRATIYALLDGEAATGAYRFDVAPGQQTTLDVAATLFPRRAGVKFGLAPLTSMYLTGENDHRVRDGFRDELHDSDGLLMLTGADEWIWRPLSNPSSERTTSFTDKSVKGFGLMQRDRIFESYQDLELAYESRPSYFVEPKGDWGAGRVELIELSTPDESNDNIVASWTPKTPPAPLQPFSYAYRLTASLDDRSLSPSGRVVNTFTAPARALGSAEKARPGACRFLVDFARGDLAYYLTDPSEVEAVATATKGVILRSSVVANPHIEGLRAMFDVAVAPGATSDLRVYLRAGARSLTETWTFPWTAPALQTSPQTLAADRPDGPDLQAATLSQQPIRN